MKWTLATRTDVGLHRRNNEDACYAADIGNGQTLLIVADGVAGRDAGEVASATSIAVFQRLAESGKLAAASDPSLAPALLAMAVQKAHVEVSRLALEAAQAHSMSCTLSVALISGERLDIAQVGDSRIYLWRDSQLQQLTEDQTVARQLIKDGRLRPEQLADHPDRNTLSQSIGLEASAHPLEPALHQITLQAGDTLLLCSDGLSDLVDDARIAEVLAATDTPDAATLGLVQAALDAGGRDNVTVVVAEAAA